MLTAVGDISTDTVYSIVERMLLSDAYSRYPYGLNLSDETYTNIMLVGSAFRDAFLYFLSNMQRITYDEREKEICCSIGQSERSGWPVQCRTYYVARGLLSMLVKYGGLHSSLLDVSIRHLREENCRRTLIPENAVSSVECIALILALPSPVGGQSESDRDDKVDANDESGETLKPPNGRKKGKDLCLESFTLWDAVYSAEDKLTLPVLLGINPVSLRVQPIKVGSLSSFVHFFATIDCTPLTHAHRIEEVKLEVELQHLPTESEIRSTLPGLCSRVDTTIECIVAACARLQALQLAFVIKMPCDADKPAIDEQEMNMALDRFGEFIAALADGLGRRIDDDKKSMQLQPPKQSKCSRVEIHAHLALAYNGLLPTGAHQLFRLGELVGEEEYYAMRENHTIITRRISLHTQPTTSPAAKGECGCHDGGKYEVLFDVFSCTKR